jgi:tripartite-type tricarboxylate transporter receptor subunit TctC
MRVLLRSFVISCLLALAAGAAQAQSWPQKPVMFIVPFAAGGGTDIFARPVAAQLEKQLGQRFIIENRAGAGGTTGAAAAAKADPDGYTYLVAASHHTIAPSIYATLPYDFVKDFVPVAMLARVPHVIVVHPGKVAAKSLKELVDNIAANPGKVNYASAGAGTVHHLTGELFKLQTKTQITHVPYRGAGPAMQDLIAGHVDMVFDGLGTSAAPIGANQIKALAVAAPKRVPLLPDVPTTAEAGFPGVEASTWYSVFAPRGTPPDIVARMIREIEAALKEPSIQEAWKRNGSEVPSVSGEALGKLVVSEVARWGGVVKEAGIKLQGQ